MNIESEMNAKITKYNPRKELHGDEGVMAGDVNIQVNIPIKEINQIAVDKVDFMDMFYTEHEELKALCFDSISFFREYEDMRVEITLQQNEEPIILAGAKIKKIKADLQPGCRVDLSFQVQLHPSEEESGELHKAMMADAVGIRVSSMQADIEEN